MNGFTVDGRRNGFEVNINVDKVRSESIAVVKFWKFVLLFWE
jgi:hypothetical protein